jgi:hypothetical protein
MIILPKCFSLPSAIGLRLLKEISLKKILEIICYNLGSELNIKFIPPFNPFYHTWVILVVFVNISSQDVDGTCCLLQYEGKGVDTIPRADVL